VDIFFRVSLYVFFNPQMYIYDGLTVQSKQQQQPPWKLVSDSKAICMALTFQLLPAKMENK